MLQLLHSINTKLAPFWAKDSLTVLEEVEACLDRISANILVMNNLRRGYAKLIALEDICERNEVLRVHGLMLETDLMAIDQNANQLTDEVLENWINGAKCESEQEMRIHRVDDVMGKVRMLGGALADLRLCFMDDPF